MNKNDFKYYAEWQGAVECPKCFALIAPWHVDEHIYWHVEQHNETYEVAP